MQLYSESQKKQLENRMKIGMVKQLEKEQFITREESNTLILYYEKQITLLEKEMS